MLITNDKLLRVAAQLLAAEIAGYTDNDGNSIKISVCSSDENIDQIVDMAEKLINEVDKRTVP